MIHTFDFEQIIKVASVLDSLKENQNYIEYNSLIMIKKWGFSEFAYNLDIMAISDICCLKLTFTSKKGSYIFCSIS